MPLTYPATIAKARRRRRCPLVEPYTPVLTSESRSSRASQTSSPCHHRFRPARGRALSNRPSRATPPFARHPDAERSPGRSPPRRSALPRRDPRPRPIAQANRLAVFGTSSCAPCLSSNQCVGRVDVHVEVVATGQAACGPRRLVHRAAGRGVGGQVAGDRDEHAVRPFRLVRAQLGMQGDPGLQHLVGVELAILPQQEVPEPGDQPRRIVTQREVAPGQAARRIDLLLPIERDGQRVEDCAASGNPGATPGRAPGFTEAARRGCSGSDRDRAAWPRERRPGADPARRPGP